MQPTIKEGNPELLYENQINFFVSQIDLLQNQLKKKTDEINLLNDQMDEIRNQLIALKKELHDSKQKNIELMNNICNNVDCPYRLKKNEKID
jgi:uncharacterized coiled-coil DUF342 family protein